MTAATTARDTVTLESCDREPIHIPGAIQSHGAMLAFDCGRRLRFHSANATEMLGLVPPLGRPLEGAHLGASTELHALLDQAFAPGARETLLPLAAEITLGQDHFDLILHQSGELLVAEFERRSHGADELASFALKAHRAMDRLKRQRSIETLLAMACEDVRQLTGFDRVMAYRFRPDDSGEVVAESVDERLEPFLGRRYPASDIPAQARRLYVASTLRLIADVGALPVALEGVAGAEPLDMSQAVLRAVSPIHIEYLQNMHVGASMSVSIVVQGRLWGMIACHHMAPRQVPYSVRMACDVIAQILAANVHTVIARLQSERTGVAATLRARMVEDLLHADDAVAALSAHAATLMQVLDAQAAIVAEGSKLSVAGDLPPGAAHALVRWLNRHDHAGRRIVAVDALAQFPSYLHPLLDVWCGLLAMRFDPAADSWLIVLRKEQVETINWGGKPDKHYEHGPNGPRLTPRGSFDLWRETVHGRAEAWSETDMAVAQQMADELVRATSARVSELNRARNQLMAVLGHDLRDPLNSISMAAKVLERSPDGGQDRLGRRIQSSSSRMQRLVSQVMDMSRLQGGLGLGLQLSPTPLAPLIADLIDEGFMAYPGSPVSRHLDEDLLADIDADRMAQVITNLLGNARHHGVTGEPVAVVLRALGDEIELQVRNVGEPIPEELAASLFNPFKRQSLGNERNRSGLGLGLYIAHEIVHAHGGRIGYSFEEPQVVFSVVLPRSPSRA